MITVAVLAHHRLNTDTFIKAIEQQPDVTVAPGLVYWEDFASAARQADVLVILYAPNRAMMSAVVRRVRQEDPDARIIPASAPDAPEITAAHFAEGICGYARRSDGVDVLTSLIRLAAAGLVVAPYMLDRPPRRPPRHAGMPVRKPLPHEVNELESAS